MLPWSLLISADIVIENLLVLQLSSQLLDLLLLFVKLFSVRKPRSSLSCIQDLFSAPMSVGI